MNFFPRSWLNCRFLREAITLCHTTISFPQALAHLKWPYPVTGGEQELPGLCSIRDSGWSGDPSEWKEGWVVFMLFLGVGWAFLW